MKYTYFVLLALASSTALQARFKKLGQENVNQATRVEFIQYQVQEPLPSKEYSGYHAYIHAANIIEYIRGKRYGVPFAPSHTQYFYNESAPWPRMLLQARLQRYLVEALLKELAGVIYEPLGYHTRDGVPVLDLELENAVLRFEDLGMFRHDVPEDTKKSMRAAERIIPGVASALLKKGITNVRFEREEIRRLFIHEAEKLREPAVGAAFDTLFPKLTTINLSAQENPTLYDCKNLIPYDLKSLVGPIAGDSSHTLSSAFSDVKCYSSEYSPTLDNRSRNWVRRVRGPSLYTDLEMSREQQAKGKLSVSFVSFDGSWMCCVTEQWCNKVCIHVLDPQNIDRKNQSEIQRLICECEKRCDFWDCWVYT